MPRLFVFLSVCALCGVFQFTAKAQDLIVTESGQTLKVYNIEMSPTTIFYQISEAKDAPTERIARKEVLIIRKADGSKLDPNAPDPIATSDKPNAAPKSNSRSLVDYPRHELVTAKQASEIITDKKGNRIFIATTPDGKQLNYRILSDSDHTLSVTKGKYHEESYIIPEYVDMSGTLYEVREIGEKAFDLEKTVKDVQFPYTLKMIADYAFHGVHLEKIILPDGLEEIGKGVFF